MSSIIKFQAISGAFNEDPLCYLLQVDEYKFLLDCGWDEKFSPNIIEEYKKHARTVDAVLISYPDVEHLGALPYLIGKCGLNCPIYGTIPVIKMGQMFMYDLCLSKSSNENFDLFSLDDIDTAFDKIQQLKYFQTVSLQDKGLGLQITPLPAGHMIGGTIWKILKEGEEEIIYAVDFNYHKEKHLNSCTFERISKPTLLITDSYNVLRQQRRRDEKLMFDSIMDCLRNSGNVLICTDTAGRVLEVAHILDQFARKGNSGLKNYSMALLNHVSGSVIGFAQSQVEWMNDKIVRSFEENRYNPFQFKHIELCDSLEKIKSLESPKLVLASTHSMECGFSRELFLEWCEHENNLIIFTIRSPIGTLTRTIMDSTNEKFVKVDVKSKVKLEGKELEDYFKMKHEKELEEENRLKKSKELESIDGMSSSSDEESEKITIENAIATGKHDIMKLQENKGKYSFFRHNRKAFPIFPFKEEMMKWDDYGQIIKSEDYIKNTTQRANELNANFQGLELDSTNDDATDMYAASSFDVGISNNPKRNNSMIDNPHETPTKCVSETRVLNLRAKRMYIDLEGRSDGESIKKIIANIKPKNLILIHGDESSTLDLAGYCQKLQIVQNRVFTPRLGEIIDATNETQIYQVKLKDNIVSTLKFQKSKEYELSWIDGIIKARNIHFEDELKTSSTVASGSLDLDYNLHPLTKEQLKLLKRKAVFVNEPKLSDLKRILVEKGFQAEFHGGVLVCNGIIALRKNETGRIILEGVVSDDYYKIRKILYNEYSVL